MRIPGKDKASVEDVLSSIREVMSGKLTQGGSPVQTQSLPKKNTLILTTAIQEDGTVKDLRTKEVLMTNKTKTETQEKALSQTQVAPELAMANTKTRSSAEIMISPKAVDDSVVALSALATHISQNNHHNIGSIEPQHFGGRTIEELTRDILKPLLKDWLDANLPSLVKWIVTEQIEKMVQQHQLKSKLE